MKKYLKRIFVLIVMLLSSVCFLFGCASDSKGNPSNGNPGMGDTGGFVNTTTDRKIIYTADVCMYGKDPDEVYQAIRAALPDDSYAETENVRTSSCTLVYRVKTNKFDEFLAALPDCGEVQSISKTAEDITDTYDTLLYRKNALETEHARLLELETTASQAEIAVSILPRLTEIETELQQINGSLGKLDSRLEYSTITIYIYATGEQPAITFGEKVSRSLKSGWNFVVEFFTGFVQFVVWLVPVLLVIIPVGAVIFVIVRLRKKHNAKKQAQHSENLARRNYDIENRARQNIYNQNPYISKNDKPNHDGEHKE